MRTPSRIAAMLIGFGLLVAGLFTRQSILLIVGGPLFVVNWAS